MYACVRSQKATVVAPAFSPAYEITDAHTVVFEAGSLRRLYPNWREMANSIAHEAGPDSQIAIAPNPDTAILLARNARGIVIVTRDAAAVLAPLPVESLPLTPELLQTFDTWGIRTIGDLAGLPERGIAERLVPRAFIYKSSPGERSTGLSKSTGPRPCIRNASIWITRFLSLSRCSFSSPEC